MKRRLAVAGLCLASVFGASAASTPPASAHVWHAYDYLTAIPPFCYTQITYTPYPAAGAVGCALTVAVAPINTVALLTH